LYLKCRLGVTDCVISKFTMYHFVFKVPESAVISVYKGKCVGHSTRWQLNEVLYSVIEYVRLNSLSCWFVISRIGSLYQDGIHSSVGLNKCCT
jgi:hypothetical protein